ncbi:MAG TPA: SO_0444 family Cu/Zn efflux transporter [bacterium]|nr:SO_0444 family Cu/Zn efflux transporter [bacterium]
MADIIIKFLSEFWGILADMSFYLLLGFVVAGILSTYISTKTVEKHLGNTGFRSVFNAAMVGVPLPLCSCGVIPVGMSLRKHGASRGAAASFLISTPQTGVDSILVTYGLLGPLFAVIRPVVALITGIIGGALVDAATTRSGYQDVTEEEKCTDSCCTGEKSERRLIKAFKHGFITLPRDIGRFLFIGILIAATLSVLIPENYFDNMLGSGLLPMLGMLVVGIPIYICSVGSVPMAAAFLAAGISPGAVLVFLMTGPATNAATITTIWKGLGKRTALIYLATIVFGSLLSGMLLDFLALEVGGRLGDFTPWMMPQIINNISAVILMIVLIPHVIRGKKKAAAVKPENATDTGTWHTECKCECGK